MAKTEEPVDPRFFLPTSASEPLLGTGGYAYPSGHVSLCGLRFFRRYDNSTQYAWRFTPMYVYELDEAAPRPRAAGDLFLLNSETGAIWEGEWSTVSPRLHVESIRPPVEGYSRSVQARAEAEKFMSEWMRENYFGYAPAVLEWHLTEAAKQERRRLVAEGILTR